MVTLDPAVMADGCPPDDAGVFIAAGSIIATVNGTSYVGDTVAFELNAPVGLCRGGFGRTLRLLFPDGVTPFASAVFTG